MEDEAAGEALQVWRILSLHGIVYQAVGVGHGWSSLTQHRGPATSPLIGMIVTLGWRCRQGRLVVRRFTFSARRVQRPGRRLRN